MKVTLKSAGKPYNYIGVNENGHTIALSGTQEAVGAMESVLMAVAACSTVDVEGILKKMRQKLHDIEVSVSAKRADAVPAVFTDIQLHYKAYGNIDEEKLQKAVQLSMDKYCSVSLMLKKSVHISYTVEVVREQ